MTSEPPMNIDPIVSELHQPRAEEMERFNFDYDAFYSHLKEQEKLSVKPRGAADSHGSPLTSDRHAVEDCKRETRSPGPVIS